MEVTPPGAERSVARRAWDAVPKQPQAIRRALSLLSSLNDLGWHRSAGERAPVGSDGGPLAWYTYPALLWLEPRLRSSDVVFEYGAGNSTRWYAARTAKVVSVEHDATWATSVGSTAPTNVTVIHRDCGGDGVSAPPHDPYVSAVADMGVGSFDVVVIDGRARVSCVDFVVRDLAPTALLVLDNSDRPQYRPALEQLAAAGLSRIDFVGPVPGSGRISCTSVFACDLGRWVRAHPDLLHRGY